MEPRHDFGTDDGYESASVIVASGECCNVSSDGKVDVVLVNGVDIVIERAEDRVPARLATERPREQLHDRERHSDEHAGQ